MNLREVTYQPKTTAEQREDFAKFPGRIGQHILDDLAACEAALAKLQHYVESTACTCRYQGDGDYITCGRCQALGISR